jgi:hypothetical protein
LEKKIIFIGFNKTATTSIHTTLMHNGIDSKHRGGVWRFKNRYNKLRQVVNRREAVSDWGDTHVSMEVLLRLNSDFDNLLFVLNTRKLENWIESRFKHYYFKKRWDFDNREFGLGDISLENAQKFIGHRNEFYLKCSESFDKNNFIILDIGKDNFYDCISSKLNFKIERLDSKKNVRCISNLGQDFIKKYNNVRNELSELYNETMLNSVLTTNYCTNQKLMQFENNIQ